MIAGSFPTPQQVPERRCAAEGCGVPLVSDWAWKTGRRPEGYSRHAARGLCSVHYDRFRRHGDTKYVGPRRLKFASAADVPLHHCVDCACTMVLHGHLDLYPELRATHRRYGGQERCMPCYNQALRDGKLERVNRSREEVLEDWVFLRDDGVDLATAARRMGMKKASLEQALYRARKRGDLRGSLVPFSHDMRRAA